jgi:tetratricopeptide (TPR) repeat protein
MGYSFEPMPRRPIVLLCALAALPPVALWPASGRADDAVEVAPDGEAARAKAQEHFKRARELYQAGSYRDAIAELEAARLLDPKAKELVFNLGIVTEKLGQFDDAVVHFRSYLEMEGITEAERAKAEAVIKRIEGAKREAPTVPTASSTPPPPPPPPKREEPRRGRVDGATIGAAGVAVAGFTVGTIFGIRALSQRPNDFVTGRDGSIDDLRSQTDSAHTSAIVADIGIGVGAVATLAALYLYFGRTRPPVKTGFAGVAAPAAIPGGGALMFGGVFR